jgi:hypothetical protein
MAEKDIQAVLNEVVRRANETVRRLRDLEENDSLIESRLNTAETGILNLSNEKKEMSDALTARLDDIDKSIIRIDNELLKLGKNVDKMAKRSEVKELENLISIYNPIKTKFITREELDVVLEERLKNVSV